ncbi:MAG: hypothetical protein VKO39_03425 [Cyanobacteriota bacterium]|nr:hypothetical protein [Cyanobacteriota bacterium]
METQPGLLPPSPDVEATALSAWESLAHRIAIAEQDSATKIFDYENPDEAKLARSWIARLRSIRGGIERARKDAKAVHIERGRAVDNTAKTLTITVDGLIAPHQDALDAIKAREDARIAAHRSVLDFIAGITEGIQHSSEIDQRLAELNAIDPTGLEEFSTAATNRQAEAIEKLETLRESLQTQEAERAELEALRREKEEREQAERAEQLRREGEERERRRQEALRQQEPEVEPPQNVATRFEPATQAECVSQAVSCSQLPAPPTAHHEDTSDLFSSLVAALKGKTARQVAQAIIDGTFHPRVTLK